MRPTLTLDEDVYAKLRERAERSGRSLQEIANDSLRHALSGREGDGERRFVVRPRAMGKPVSESGYDDVPKLLEEMEPSEPR